MDAIFLNKQIFDHFLMIISIIGVFMTIFRRSLLDISDINAPYDYDYDRYVATGNQALGGIMGKCTVF